MAGSDWECLPAALLQVGMQFCHELATSMHCCHWWPLGWQQLLQKAVPEPAQLLPVLGAISLVALPETLVDRCCCRCHLINICTPIAPGNSIIPTLE
jgi:hypothetical protein